MLLDKYRQIFNRGDWKYYHSPSIISFPFDSPHNAENFIETMFKMGGKGPLYNEFPTDDFRNIHSISTYFLGFMLKDIMELHKLKPDFRYLWFLSSLYHDYGYFVEKNIDKFNLKENHLTNLKKTLKVTHDILKRDVDRENHITRDVVYKYYQYCRKDRKSLNHGIVGGLLFYDHIIRIFYEKQKEALDHNPYIEKDDFEFQSLQWSISHFDDYKIIANSIIDHNIWYAYKDEDIAMYERRKLHDLIIHKEEKPKLTFQSNPFVFLLVLTDSIEPIKAFREINHNCILDKIDIETNKAERSVIITILDDCINYKPWFCKIKEMEKWVGVRVESEESNGNWIKITPTT